MGGRNHNCRSVPRGSNEVAQSGSEGGHWNCAKAFPTGKVEAEWAEVRTQGSAQEECNHVVRVDSAPRGRDEAVDARLVSDVRGLNADVDQHDRHKQTYKHAAKQ